MFLVDFGFGAVVACIVIGRLDLAWFGGADFEARLDGGEAFAEGFNTVGVEGGIGDDAEGGDSANPGVVESNVGKTNCSPRLVPTGQRDDAAVFQGAAAKVNADNLEFDSTKHNLVAFFFVEFSGKIATDD